jgi:NAD(P)H-quinone oxidoreductase subunit 5
VLLKVMPLLRFAPLAIDVLLVVGTISAIGGALVAMAQVDIKRAFSYSTTSYLGLVFIAIALQEPAFALLLLFSHGLAKALVYMSVGSIIATSNCQDLTELGGLARRMPATTMAYLVGAAGLTGLAPLGCFWCFGLLTGVLGPQAPFFAAVVLITNFLTVINLTRVYRAAFLGAPHPKTKRAPEVNWLMALPMVSLTVLVLLTPLVMVRIFSLSGITDFSPATAALVLASSLGGLILGSLLPRDRFRSRSTLQPLRRLQDLLAADFYTERIYRATIVAFVAALARFTDGFDQVVVNGLVNRIGLGSMAGAENLRLGVSGQLQSYVLTVLAAIVLLFASLAWMFR